MTSREIDTALKKNDGLVFSFLIKHGIHKEHKFFEDYAQEMRIVLWNCLKAYDPTMGAPFGPYVFVCMWNKLYQLKIKRKKRIEDNVDVASLYAESESGDPLIDSIEDGYSYEDVSDARLTADIMLSSDAALSGKNKKIFIALKMVAEGFTYEEAGRMLGCSKQNIEQYLRRARRLLDATIKLYDGRPISSPILR